MSDNFPSAVPRKGRGALGVAVALFVFAVLLAFNPVPFTSPVRPAAPVPAWVTDPTPVRQPKPRPEYSLAVFTYRCSECHRIIPPRGDTLRSPTQHLEIDLQHGMNTSCGNCHHPTNRDAFVDDSGHEIPWDQPQLVCAKCHGPVYRDWQHGSHGRTNGYWDVSRGPQTRRKCIECHDPHRPPFPAMHPAPPPNTLRMGPQHDDTHAQEDNPLRLSVRPPGRTPPGDHKTNE